MTDHRRMQKSSRSSSADFNVPMPLASAPNTVPCQVALPSAPGVTRTFTGPPLRLTRSSARMAKVNSSSLLPSTAAMLPS